MKKYAYSLLLALCLVPVLSACGKKEDYSAHLSEIRSDLFVAKTDEFTLELACVSREYPYNADGVACPRSELIEISLRGEAADYTVYLTGENTIGGDMSFRNTRGDYFYSQGVKNFPQGSVTLCVEWGENSREITATSVKNEKTLSVTQALNAAVKAEQETLAHMHKDGVFRGEFYVRLLRRDRNYYYVGIVDADGNVLSLLLDSETGAVLARRA